MERESKFFPADRGATNPSRHNGVSHLKLSASLRVFSSVSPKHHHSERKNGNEDENPSQIDKRWISHVILIFISGTLITTKKTLPIVSFPP